MALVGTGKQLNQRICPLRWLDLVIKDLQAGSLLTKLDPTLPGLSLYTTCS